MHEPRHSRVADVGSSNGYAEMDPTGRYGHFHEVLGKGATKVVYRAFDELTGMEVAWNQARLSEIFRQKDVLARIYSEVELLSTLRHDSIIKYFFSWVDVSKRTINFITEMFTSGTLREYRQKYPRVDMRAIKNWARQILHGLVYLHSHDPPVIHRDLKCDNIFVNGHLGQVKIGDLGLAAVLRGTQSAHSVIGTPEFMAPELYEEDYNELVDVYSFGMCMLEMITAEFPYSECTNPAQIYKKVTAGKLPAAYHLIQDSEVRRFIGRCLAHASGRSSAKELLLDPFLVVPDQVLQPGKCLKTYTGSSDKFRNEDCSVHKAKLRDAVHRTDMTITGKLNPEDDSIFLKVQIADEEGQVRNIYFPFDTVSDTPEDVADEMVKELEIADWTPEEIANMIAEEISMLVPGWNHRPSRRHHDEYDHRSEDGGDNPPFNCLSSPSSNNSSQFCIWSKDHGHAPQIYREDQYLDDEDMSSLHSGRYSDVSYRSINEDNEDGSSHYKDAMSEFPAQSLHARNLSAQFQIGMDRSEASTSQGSRYLMRNRSMVDMRSRGLHRALLEALRLRQIRTVDSVESIGYHHPCSASAWSLPPSKPNADRKKSKKPSSRGVRQL